MAIALHLPPPALIAPVAMEGLERVAGTVPQPNASPVTVLVCQMSRSAPLVPRKFTIAFRVDAAEVRNFNLPKPTPRVFARIVELTQAHVVVSWAVDGFTNLYPGFNGFDEVRYHATYVAATGAIFVLANPATHDFTNVLRDNTQQASGTCQQVK